MLLLARELGLLKLGMASIDGTKIDANASKMRSLRYDRAKALSAQLERDIAELMARADEDDGQSLPKEIARRAALKVKLDAACARLEDDAKAQCEAERAGFEEKQRKHAARNGQGRPPKPPDDTPSPGIQSNPGDPDSALMRKSKRHEYRQAYNAQAVVDADGSQLVLVAGVSRSPSDAPTFEETIERLCDEVGQPDTVLADAGYAQEQAVARLETRRIEALVVVSRPEGGRVYDFRPPKPDSKPPPEIRAELRKAMQAKLQTGEAKEKYKRRKCTVEPVFGIIKFVLGFTHFRLRGITNVTNEWLLVTLAYNCKRLVNLGAA